MLVFIILVYGREKKKYIYFLFYNGCTQKRFPTKLAYGLPFVSASPHAKQNDLLITFQSSRQEVIYFFSL